MEYDSPCSVEYRAVCSEQEGDEEKAAWLLSMQGIKTRLRTRQFAVNMECLL